MFLSKLVVDVTSREFRRDCADIRQMHRTVMSGFVDVTDGSPARQAHAVLWRLDPANRGYIQYVQSASQPDWSRLPEGYLCEPAQVRSMQPALDAIVPGRRLAFRMIGNPTRTVGRSLVGANGPSPSEGAATANLSKAKRTQGRTVALRKPDEQIQWLIRHAERSGFVIPTGANGQPDLAPSPCPTLTGRRGPGDTGPITVEPVRFEGHLIVTDPIALGSALRNGIGRAKAYGCGLLSLAPARTAG